MKAWVEIQSQSGVKKFALTPITGLPRARATCKCPGCGADPLIVQGGNPRRMPDDRTIRSEGHTVCCGDAIGYLYARPDTLFGLEEDARVAQRCRVY